MFLVSRHSTNRAGIPGRGGALPKGSVSFRLGATSYVLPDHILPNVEFLAPLVDDVELVLFETDDHGSNLPDGHVTDRLRELAAEHDLTYTVHLPLDLRLGERDEPDHLSLIKARRVIEATGGIDPYAYVLHLDGSAVCGSPQPAVVTQWQAQSMRALEAVCEWLERPERLSVENVEGWDPELFAPVIERLPVSRVVDVGHLWLQSADPVEHLARWLERTRVVHLHGIGQRDHSSLAAVGQDLLDPVVDFLRAEFTGIVTLEVFALADFHGSLDALASSLQRLNGGSQ